MGETTTRVGKLYDICKGQGLYSIHTAALETSAAAKRKSMILLIAPLGAELRSRVSDTCIIIGSMFPAASSLATAASHSYLLPAA